MGELGKTDAAWKDILDKYPEILSTVSDGGIYQIAASDIKEFREPRLMTKHDTWEGVPAPLKANKLNVLSVSRSAYALSDFVLHEDFPDVSGMRPLVRSLPDFETLTVDNITSESNAINALIASGILDEFVGGERTVETFNGRMGSGDFDFYVDRRSGGKAHVEVHGAQLEIDGGFENDENVVIMEAKNVRHDNFNVRQLYYPFRKYQAFVKKPIKLVFSQYTNLTYYLFEYEFVDVNDFSSITLVRKEAYTFEDTRITPEDLWDTCAATRVRTTDDIARTGGTPPFPQADRFDRVVALMERLAHEPEGMTTDAVAEFMGTTVRQANYYPAAGDYLGVFDRGSRNSLKLSAIGESIVKMKYRDRQLAFAGLMFEHEIFNRLFADTYRSGSLPAKERVMDVMRELNVCGNNEVTIGRRASTVLGWLRWLVDLPDEDA